MKYTDLNFNDDGTVTAETKGVKGQGCTKLADEIIQTIGGTVKKRQKTGEFYAKAEVKQQTKNKT